MADTVTYRLSSIDQSLIRTYVRYCLCYPCSDEQIERDQVEANLNASVKRALSYMPVFAGDVYPVDAFASCLQAAERRSSLETVKEDEQSGQVEVRVTLAQVENFKPIIKHLEEDELPYTYETLAAEKMPATAFIGDVLGPLADSPDPTKGSAPAFAIQANFIQGGVLVCLYVHHSVADLGGLAALMRHMSISEEILPERVLTLQALKEDALEKSRMRDRLSGSRGVKADLAQHPEYDVEMDSPSLAPSNGTCRILTFSLDMLNGTRDMVNERFQYMHSDPGVHLSAFDCLTALLWKGITRARWPRGTSVPGQTSALLIPVNISKKIDPPLAEGYIGNSCLFSYVSMPMLHLGLPFDVGTLAKTAHCIREGILSMTESKVRSAVAIINETEDVRALNHPRIDFSNDVFITNWESLPVEEEAGLSLGIGAPQWSRKVSAHHSGYGCVLLPKKDDNWEVLVQLTEDAMERLLDDPGLKPFILEVA